MTNPQYSTGQSGVPQQPQGFQTGDPFPLQSTGYYQQQPAPRKKGMPTWGKVLLTIFAVLALCGGGGLVACTALVGNAVEETGKQIEADQAAKASGVTIPKNGCITAQAANDIFPHIAIKLEITNTTADQQTYVIDLFVKDAKTKVRVANGTAIVSDVRPGQKVTHEEQVSLTSKLANKTVVECTVDKVS